MEIGACIGSPVFGLPRARSWSTVHTRKDNRRRMALQATLSVSLKAGFSSRRKGDAIKNSPMRAAYWFRLKGYKIPPHVNKDQHTVQTHVQAISFTGLLVANAPVFYFSFEFFFNLFHSLTIFPISITNNDFNCHHLLGLIPPFRQWQPIDFAYIMPVYKNAFKPSSDKSNNLTVICHTSNLFVRLPEGLMRRKSWHCTPQQKSVKVACLLRYKKTSIL